jgi:hypothetical protein
MKLIGVLQGYAALRESLEEYLPERGLDQNEMIGLIVERYAFQGFPRLPAGTGPQPFLNFAAGKFSIGDQSFAVTQLAMYPHGDIAVATTTDQAETVLNDLIGLLNDKLGLKLDATPDRKSFLSNIVVEFDNGLASYIKKIGKINSAINNARPGKSPFDTKRFAFGIGDVEMTNDGVVNVERSDFVIERRQGAPYDRNRYFSSAPMTTSDHIRVLEQIEAIASGDTD